MSPMEMVINISLVDDPEWTPERAEKIRAAHEDNPQFVRIPGVSKTGPCAECAVFFYVVHDGSGKDVPLPQLHDNCVCSDVPLAMYEAGETENGTKSHELPPDYHSYVWEHGGAQTPVDNGTVNLSSGASTVKGFYPGEWLVRTEEGSAQMGRTLGAVRADLIDRGLLDVLGVYRDDPRAGLLPIKTETGAPARALINRIAATDVSHERLDTILAEIGGRAAASATRREKIEAILTTLLNRS